MKDSIADLERQRLNAARDLAETKRAYDAAVRDAQRRGVDPERDIVVVRLRVNLKTAEVAHQHAVDKHQAAFVPAA